MKYYVIDNRGKEVKPGQTITSAPPRRTGTFEYVSRGEPAKVIVDGREYYARAWNLSVSEASGE